MTSKQFFVAGLCVLLTAVDSVRAQSASFIRGPVAPPMDKPKWVYDLTRNYRVHPITGVNLTNSNRLSQLVRAGNLYLSLQDAIALTLENNVDIEIQRYTPELAQIDFNRAQAGGLIRGVSQQVTGGAQSAVNFITGGFGGGTGNLGVGGGNTGGGGTALSGTVFQVTGTNIPNLDPVFTLGYNGGKTSSPQTNSFTSGLTALVAETRGMNASISKQFLTGTGISLAYDNTRIFSNSPLNDLNPFNRGNMSLALNQRLLQGFGRAVNNRNIVVAKNNMKGADLTFKNQVISTVASVINLYWDLVSFNENVRVRKQALELAQKTYSDRKKEVDIGTLAPIEIVRAEAEVARNQQDLTLAETQVLQQETILKNQLSRNGVANPVIADVRIITTDKISVPETESVSPIQDLVDLALKSRPELEQTRINIENTKIGLSGARSALLPSLDVSASTGNRALAGSNNVITRPGIPPRVVDPFFVGGYGAALSQIFRRNFPDWNAGFQLNVPLRNRAAQADIANDTLRLRTQELQEQRQINGVRVDVQNALIALQQARAQYQAAVKNRVLQEQTLEAEQKKYALGSSTVFFVIQAQRDLALAQQSEVAAVTSYTRARNQLDVATGQLLTTYSVSLAEAMQGSVARAPALPVSPQTAPAK